MGSFSLKTMKRLVRDGQSNEVTDERLTKLIESGLWDVVVDAPDYGALLADIRRGRGDDAMFRLTDDEVVIEMPALKRPTPAEVRKDWSGVRSIESDHSTEEAVTLRLSTVLRSTETRIDGTTYERWLMKLRTDGKLLGFQHRQWLLENQKKFPALMALLGKVYIDFAGIIVVDEGGDRDVPCVSSGGKQFVGGWSWLGSGFSVHGRLAVSSK